jgi:hypothetical protein
MNQLSDSTLDDAASPALPLPTWEVIRGLLDQPSRPPAWRRTAHWTLDTLEAELGATWPVDAVEQFDVLPVPLILAGGHTLAFLETVELALRLHLLRGVNGFARARTRSALATSPRKTKRRPQTWRRARHGVRCQQNF